MGILIFFGTALLIFIMGVSVISITLYHWFKAARQKKLQEKESVTLVGN